MPPLLARPDPSWGDLFMCVLRAGAGATHRVGRQGEPAQALGHLHRSNPPVPSSLLHCHLPFRASVWRVVCMAALCMWFSHERGMCIGQKTWQCKNVAHDMLNLQQKFWIQGACMPVCGRAICAVGAWVGPHTHTHTRARARASLQQFVRTNNNI